MMTQFNQRTIVNHETLGEKLKRIRLDKHSSVDEVAKALQIRSDYVIAIESSNYKALPSSVFVRHYIRNYAKFLRMPVESIQEALEAELKVYDATPEIPTLKRHLTKKPLRLAQVIILISIVFLMLGVGVYFTFEISNSLRSPVLTVEPVPSTVTAAERFVTIAGQTAPEAIVSINDQPIAVQDDGKFTQAMTLQTGSNIFKVSAKTKRSAATSQYIQIYVEDK